MIGSAALAPIFTVLVLLLLTAPLVLVTLGLAIGIFLIKFHNLTDPHLFGT
ncbi:hypothetical protein LOS78_17810 [Paracoccus sp. MA]|uniref:hypothetical protein n=1 Tax=Paracoccus sp. MA TaxID=2895796 RepID=UPI001E31140F|nr:hypothetical protein [Paracoccus sp. MA]UFM65487.1 hypothetical protein LOS78_17810 [Paracoccus sp. MA]